MFPIDISVENTKVNPAVNIYLYFNKHSLINGFNLNTTDNDKQQETDSEILAQELNHFILPNKWCSLLRDNSTDDSRMGHYYQNVIVHVASLSFMKRTTSTQEADGLVYAYIFIWVVKNCGRSVTGFEGVFLGFYI